MLMAPLYKDDNRIVCDLPPPVWSTFNTTPLHNLSLCSGRRECVYCPESNDETNQDNSDTAVVVTSRVAYAVYNLQVDFEQLSVSDGGAII